MSSAGAWVQGACGWAQKSRKAPARPTLLLLVAPQFSTLSSAHLPAPHRRYQARISQAAAASCSGGDLSRAAAEGFALCFVVVMYQPGGEQWRRSEEARRTGSGSRTSVPLGACLGAEDQRGNGMRRPQCSTP